MERIVEQIFYVSPERAAIIQAGDYQLVKPDPGWYYAFDDEDYPIGPFTTEAAARADARLYGWPYNNAE